MFFTEGSAATIITVRTRVTENITLSMQKLSVTEGILSQVWHGSREVQYTLLEENSNDLPCVFPPYRLQCAVKGENQDGCIIKQRQPSRSSGDGTTREEATRGQPTCHCRNNCPLTSSDRISSCTLYQHRVNICFRLMMWQEQTFNKWWVRNP